MSNVSAADATEAAIRQMVNSDRGLKILPIYLGGYLDSLMMGILICQVFNKLQFVKTDRKHIVGLVAAFSLASVLATSFILVGQLRIFVWEFGTYSTFVEVAWIIRYMTMEVTIIFLVQMLYMDRACRLFSHWWPAAIIGPFSLATMILGSILLHKADDGTNSAAVLADPKFAPTNYAWYSMIIVTDSLITAIIVFGLYRMQSTYKQTRSILRRLMIAAFESQAPALVSALVCIVAWSRIFEVALALVVLQSKIYAIGALITLNLRAELRAKTSSQSNDVNVYPAQHTTGYAMEPFSDTRSQGGIQVVTESYTSSDTRNNFANRGARNVKLAHSSADSLEDIKQSIQDKDMDLGFNTSAQRLV